MKRSNLGFTLVELIVSVAIFGVVALGAAGFILSGTKTYNSVNTTVRLQYESQMVMNQIQQYVLACNGGIAWDETTGTLYITREDNVNLFRYDGDTNQIKFATCTKGASLSYDEKTMAEHITGMNVSISEDDQNLASSVQINLELTLNGSTYLGKQTIALRNRPVYVVKEISDEGAGNVWNELLTEMDAS